MSLLVEIVLITELEDRVGPQRLNYKDFKKNGERLTEILENVSRDNATFCGNKHL